MTRCLILALALLSTQALAQSKKDRKTIKALQADIAYLASDALEGRRTGAAGERLAADYLRRRYEDLKIPGYHGTYIHPFSYSLGRELDTMSRLTLDGESLSLTSGDDAFAFPFSANGAYTGDILPDLMEHGAAWLIPLYRSQEDADNPHFDTDKEIHGRAAEAAKQGAKAVLFYDSYGSRYAPERTMRTEYDISPVPVLFIGHEFAKAHIAADKSHLPIELNIQLKKADRRAMNVAAYLDNGAPYTVVIGAHYDHLGHGEDGNSLQANAASAGLIHNGADDNASGTAGVLQLAERIKKAGLKKYNYLFLHFSGEELGLLGSKAFVNDLKLDSATTAYMLNMDMIGRLVDSTRALTIGGLGTSAAWGGVVPKAARGFRLVRDSSGVGPSDHTSFYNAGIPVLFFFTGIHGDYHKPSDDADKVNYLGEAQVLNSIYGLVADMEKMPKPAYTVTRSTAMGKTRFKVTLGILPDYAWTDRGLRIDGVTDGRPAQKAGLQRGDIITQMGEYSVQGIQSYMEGLGKFKKGDKTTLRFLRGEKEITVAVEFQ